MRLLYLLPILPPKIPEAEAISQEIELLRTQHPGQIVYLNPNIHWPKSLPRIPRLFFGWHKLAALWQIERNIDLHHFYNPDPFAYPILRWLRKPVVYSLSGGLTPQFNRHYFARMGAITTLSDIDQHTLQQQGLRNVFRVRPSVDAARFTIHPLPLTDNGPIRLMMASAPWTLAQFASKGIDALLAATQRNPRLHLVLLWRGVLLDEVHRRIAAARVAERVTVIDGLADLNAVLATVHASIVLAADAQIIKAYPQSLLDSLAAGKPILLSRAIPFAQDVERTNCGQIIESVTPEAILHALDALIAHYPQHTTNIQPLIQSHFSPAATLATFTQAYQHALMT